MNAGKPKDHEGSKTNEPSAGETDLSPSEDLHRVLPTPVRASMGVDHSEPEDAERTVEVAGKTWFVRIVGASRGGRSLKDVGLVEFEFEPTDGDGDPERRLIARESGRELSDLELEELLGRG